MTGDERISTDRLSLTLSSLTTSDSGTYTCTTPGGRHDTDNTTLVISCVVTADSGVYICSAIASDSSGSQYVVDSDEVSYTVSILVSK